MMEDLEKEAQEMECREREDLQASRQKSLGWRQHQKQIRDAIEQSWDDKIKEIIAKMRRGEALTAAEWWSYAMEDSGKFTADEIQKYQNIGMPREIARALDRLKFSGLNWNDQLAYAEEVQEVATYYEELERQKEEGLQEGLQEGIQKGLQWGQINGLIERFLDHESLQKSLGRIEQNSISRDLVEQVWRDFVQNQPVPDGENLEDFVQIFRDAGILQ
ncbi:MAG: hypothetical protein LBD60_04240 [Puniceicoccales bacterium]|jgi:hypothetical protein|nr:hypothetical protein [Puniceicoccales bacterium]